MTIAGRRIGRDGVPAYETQSFYLSEIEFKDPSSLEKFVSSRPKLKKLTLREVTIPTATLDAIRAAGPELEIVVVKD